MNDYVYEEGSPLGALKSAANFGLKTYKGVKSGISSINSGIRDVNETISGAKQIGKTVKHVSDNITTGKYTHKKDYQPQTGDDIKEINSELKKYNIHPYDKNKYVEIRTLIKNFNNFSEKKQKKVSKKIIEKIYNLGNPALIDDVENLAKGTGSDFVKYWSPNSAKESFIDKLSDDAIFEMTMLDYAEI